MLIKRNQPGSNCCCDQITACFTGKCFRIVINNTAGEEEGDCCQSLNGTTYFLPVQLYGFYYPSIDRTGCVATGDSGDITAIDGCTVVNIVGGVVIRPCGLDDAFDVMGFGIYLGDGLCSNQSGWVPFPLTVDSTEEDILEYIAAVHAAIGSLCSGGSVTLNWSGPESGACWPEPAGTGLCDLSASTITVSLVDEGEDCTPLPPFDPEGPSDCDDLDECTDFGKLNVHIADFQDCTIPDDAGAHPYLEERFYSNLNNFGVSTGYLMGPVPTVASFHCFSPTKYDFFTWRAPYEGLTELERYAIVSTIPNLLLRRETHSESYRDEYYVIALEMQTECDPDYMNSDNARWFLRQFHIKLLFYRWLWDGIGFNDFQLYNEYCDTYDTITPGLGGVLKTFGAVPVGCLATRGGSTAFDYDLCGVTDSFSVTFKSFVEPVPPI